MSLFGILEEKKFNNHFSRTISACNEYEYSINPNDKENAKGFVTDYLEWAKPILLQKSEIEMEQVQTKIDEMLKKFE